MVNLLPESNIDRTQYPNIHRWDQAVRKHHHTYQELIDAQTYRIQRIQRGFLVYLHLYRHSPIPSFITLNYSHYNYSKGNSKSDKSIKIKSISTNKLILVLPHISTGPLIPAGIYLFLD